jgi:hypothetical protein
MNLALGAIILTLLFLPAVSFRIAVNRLENLKGLLSALSVTDSIWVFTIIPLIIHALLVLLLAASGVIIKFDLILHIIYSNENFPLSNRVLAADIPAFLGYNLIALLLGFISGTIVNSLEKRWGLISGIFGLRNDWYEAFEGDVLKKNREKCIPFRMDAVYIDVLSDTKEASILYSGIFMKYYFKPRSSELDYLVLRDAMKKYVDGPHSEMERSGFYDFNTGDGIPIKGDYLIIPMKEVLNINVTYIYLDFLFVNPPAIAE